MQTRGDAEAASHKVVPVWEVIWCGEEARSKVTLLPSQTAYLWDLRLPALVRK